MRYGAHLPLIDFDGTGWRPGGLAPYADAARELGYAYLTANDHLVFQRPWLDGIIALASVLERSGDVRLATTIALPVVRGPAALAKAAAALAVLSGGRFTLGVGPGSSPRDYDLAGVGFEDRWPRFDASIRALRAHLSPGGLEPTPSQVDGPPIWIGSWGSTAGLRRVARLGDGWLASAYNLSPEQAGPARAKLGDALATAGRSLDGFPCALATMWTYVTDSRTERESRLAGLEQMLNRSGLAGQVLIGPAEECAATLRAYRDAGIDHVFIWPLADPVVQLERVMREVVPLV